MASAPRPLLITGCGRSGTKYTATLLSHLGVPCTHEAVFTGRPTDTGYIRPGTGESSWFAVPYLDKVGPEVVVLHQVRHPMGTIRSYLQEGFFRDRPVEGGLAKHLVKRAVGAPPSGQYRLIQMVRDELPSIWDAPTQAERAARFWVRWNERAEQRSTALGLDYQRVRLEDIDVDLVRTVLERMNVTPGEPLARDRVDEVPTNVNARPRRLSLTWAEMGAAADEVRALARRYGYEDGLYDGDGSPNNG